MFIFFSRFIKKIFESISLFSEKHRQKKKQNYLKEIKLSKNEAKLLLDFFTHININNIENENAIWTELLTISGSKNFQKIINSKSKFSSYCRKMENKLKKIMKIFKNESSSSAKEKLLVCGLVYLELLSHNDEELNKSFQKLNFKGTSIKEFNEAISFIRNSSKDLAKNIEDELLKLFKNISKHKRKIEEKKKSSLNLLSSSTSHKRSPSKPKLRIRALSKTLDNQIYYFNSEQQLTKNFNEYLNFKKYEVIEELSIFEKTHDDTHHNEAQRILIENFLDDKEFKEFLSQMNQEQTFGSLSPDLMFEELEEKGAGKAKKFFEVIERKSKILNLHEIELSGLNKIEKIQWEEEKEMFDINNKAINIDNLANHSIKIDTNFKASNSSPTISKINLQRMNMSQFVIKKDNRDYEESSEGESDSEKEEIIEDIRSSGSSDLEI